MSDTAPLAPSPSINASIEELLPRFNDISQRQMTKPIRDAGKATL